MLLQVDGTGLLETDSSGGSSSEAGGKVRWLRSHRPVILVVGDDAVGAGTVQEVLATLLLLFQAVL